MNVVDSSGWLEYFADGANADFSAPSIENTRDLLVPTLSLYEVFKRTRLLRDEGQALQVVTAMQQGRVLDLTPDLALAAAELSIEHRLPMADSVILATARAHDATLWTQDEDFATIEGVRYVPAKRVTGVRDRTRVTGYRQIARPR
jgi:predicted nucleic acid-binding protein